MRAPAIGVVALVMAALLASPAGANTKKANTDRFSRSGDVVNVTLQTCVHYRITGSLKYVAKRYGPTAITNDIDWRLERLRVVTPTLAAQTYKYDPGSHRCTSRPQRVSEIAFSERHAGFACDWNPAISISAPWGVGLSFWPSCSSKPAAIFSGHHTTPGTGLSKGWDSARVKYGDQHLGLKRKGDRPDKPQCYGVIASFDIRIGGSARAFKAAKRHKICPTPKW
jgi:hypothetical protein